MKQNRSANTGVAHSQLLKIFSLVALTVAIASVAKGGIGGNRRWRESLESGDILYVDSGNAMEGGGLFKVNPQTGERSVISMGGLLQMPFGVTVDAKSGMIVVSDSGRLVAVDPMTGEQTLVADNANGALGMPCGMDFDMHRDLVVANAQAIVRMDADRDRLQVVSIGGNLRCPVGVALGQAGELFVANMSFPSEIVRVDSRTGEQTVIARGGLLHSPQAIAAAGNDLFVTDVATPDGNFGVGRVIHIDATTGEQSVVSEGDLLVGPVGIAIEADGQLIVGDPYTINPESHDQLDGAVLRINPETGEQHLLARGMDGFVNPRGVTIVPMSPSAKCSGISR